MDGLVEKGAKKVTQDYFSLTGENESKKMIEEKANGGTSCIEKGKAKVVRVETGESGHFTKYPMCAP